MMKKKAHIDTNKYIQQLVGQPLVYGLKSPDTDLYDIGFGKIDKSIDSKGNINEVSTYSIHAMCEFKIIWMDNKYIDYYDANTCANQFLLQTQKLTGCRVKRVKLSEKNDLWLDLGICWIVFITFESNSESWRFFTAKKNYPHLVASDLWLRLDF